MQKNRTAAIFELHDWFDISDADNLFITKFKLTPVNGDLSPQHFWYVGSLTFLTLYTVESTSLAPHQDTKPT